MNLPMVTWNTAEFREQHSIGARTLIAKNRVPGFHSYTAMLCRCFDSERDAYAYYGGRGITVCARWVESFDHFIADMGQRPSKAHSLDRIDPNGNYTPENCRWATATEQGRNRRNNHLLTAFGETKPISAWAADDRCAVGKEMLRYRVLKGWDVETAITKPPAPSYPRSKTKGATGENECAARDCGEVA